jgi:endoglucanase
MKKTITLFFLIILIHFSASSTQWIRVNQLGYLPDDSKNAVWLTNQPENIKEFKIVDNITKKVVFSGKTVTPKGAQGALKNSYRLNFSVFNTSGSFYIKAGQAQSPVFKIGSDVYASAAEMPLKYMRQQRCGFNPYLKDSCHRDDGRIIYHPTRTGEKIDATGGWHDASDYLQYVTTSANAIYQMLFAYSQYPNAFGDHYQANGLEGSNGIPDVLDEAKWGLDWLLKMNPDKDTYFNQIADDRDHIGFKLPKNDNVDYGWGKGKDRPVYFCTGEKQGLFRYKNRTTGLASTVGKFASSFSLGADLLATYYPEYSKLLKVKSVDAYNKGVQFPGVCQTAPCGAPYFYEEDNYSDDMQLAAAQIYKSTGETKYLKEAVEYGRMEPVTPWMGADSAKHYQWYPFVNLGHYQLAAQNSSGISNEFIRNMKSGLERVRERAGNDVFMNGIPFIWCSNNLTVALITQCHLYRKLTGDTSFQEMETSMRDWLFGCNPWGKCMIVGMPEDGDYPHYPHSAFTQLNHYPIDGGLVDGPVYASLFKSLKGVRITGVDKYADFQSDKVVYHDDYADYSTNEPTMDGTASLCYYLAYLSSEAISKDTDKTNMK